MGFVKQVWRGEKSLIFTYWIFAILGNFGLRMADVYLVQLGYGVDSTQGILFFLFNIFYAVFISVAVWRSASKYIILGNEIENGATFWGYIAQGMVILGWTLPIVLATVLLL